MQRLRTSNPSAGRRRALSILATATLLAGASSCVSTQTSAEANVRAIHDIPTLEALPLDARPIIKVSLQQDGSYEVPEQYRWIMAFSNSDSSVASGENLESKLTGALLASGRFRVRTNEFSDLQQEKELEESGDMNAATPLGRGKVMRAQYAIRANVTDLNYGEEESGSAISVPIPFLGRQSLGKSEKVATVAITAEIVNIETGELVQSVEGRGRQTSASSKVAFSVRGVRLSQQEKKDPTLANAISECIAELVYEIGQSIPASNVATPADVQTAAAPAAAVAAPSPQAGAFCTGCGQARAGEAKFCGHCGAAFGG